MQIHMNMQEKTLKSVLSVSVLPPQSSEHCRVSFLIFLSFYYYCYHDYHIGTLGGLVIALGGLVIVSYHGYRYLHRFGVDIGGYGYDYGYVRDIVDTMGYGYIHDIVDTTGLWF
ncbi:hypothetical protein BDDG_12713 [Blastomyces dermatitidis ATCC 18188]|uniref:Uncharacterized protein n=1 Tax=Ajellomyces dermatitidis (strain ATCC 18188 / CBS 674.68) TaxID=653446 RepID=A0A0J9EQF7_AJEDA|nr:hypothetical protein BDDG_12713 [Blastomyces dermatitidis ATCC 18188]